MIFLLGRMGGKGGDPGETNVFQAVGYYWHFVDFMWIGIFSCLFLLEDRLSSRDCEDMRTKLRVRYLLPGLLVAGVAVVGLLTSGASASQARHAARTAPRRRSSRPPARPATPSRTTCPRAPTSRPGETLFELNCSSCHGVDASGTRPGPEPPGPRARHRRLLGVDGPHAAGGGHRPAGPEAAALRPQADPRRSWPS